MNKKIGYTLSGAVLVLALVFSLYTPESNLVGYASKSLVVDNLFNAKPEVMQQMVGGDDPGDFDFPCQWNEDCPNGYYCNAGDQCQYVGECVERGRCGYGCVRYAAMDASDDRR